MPLHQTNPNKMNQDSFKHIPSHIIIDILSGLPVRDITRCKSVCKSWLGLLSSPEYVSLHLSKSGPGLAIFQEKAWGWDTFYRIYEFVDEHEDDDDEDDDDIDLHCNLVTDFELPHDGSIQGSANGFLFLRDFSLRNSRFFVCNPVTREYLEIHCPDEFNYRYPQVVTFGFGVSRKTGQHKVVRIFHDCTRDEETQKLLRISKSECHVYNLGTGSWRASTAPAPFEYNCRSTGSFLNGNLHWLVVDLNQKPWVSVFDLETEIYTTFSLPPFVDEQSCVAGVFPLGDWLCLSDHTSNDRIVVWLMKEYGDEKSWTKEFTMIIGDLFSEPWDVARPIKVFENGDILMGWEYIGLFFFFSKTRTSSKITGLFGHVDSILHTSSFLSLKSFGMEDVISF